MYGWSEDSTADSDAPSSEGFDFKSAREAYAGDSAAAPAKTGRSSRRSKAVTVRSRAVDFESRVGKTEAPVGKNISTDSTHPIGIAIDETGSMSDTPGIIFEKLPLLGDEVKRYAPNYSISFTAFGDAHCDNYPLQVRDFGSGSELDAHSVALYPEGDGGDAPESHNLVAYYYVYHCEIPKAVKPLFFFITDVRSHGVLKAKAVKKYTGDEIQSDLDSNALFKKLGEKFKVYVLLRGYSKGSSETKYWEDIFGAQQVKNLGEPRDVVELIIGIIANEMGELKDFTMRSSRRHEDKPERVERVIKSIKSGGPIAPDPSDSAKKSGGAGGPGSKKMKSRKLTEDS